jgi:alpha-galactosidase/6-phospho-beta-glucosidase family protein
MREAPTIVLIGAGSTSFGLSTLHDLYADAVQGGTIWLVDIATRPLERMRCVAAALEAATARPIRLRSRGSYRSRASPSTG